MESFTQMNGVEIEQDITEIVDQPFDLANFYYVFLEAFGKEITTIKCMLCEASNRFKLVGVLRPSISTFWLVKRAKAR
ncbi:hypothetical protein ACKS2G_003367 [Cronobacter sakazakii]